MRQVVPHGTATTEREAQTPRGIHIFGVKLGVFRIELLLLLGICLLPAIIRAPFLNIPLMNDEGIYATIARGMLHGSLPYRDLFDVTPPGTYVLYALGFLTLGQHVWVPHLVLNDLPLPHCFAGLHGSQAVFSSRVALGAALVFALSTGIVQVIMFANDEAFVILPVAASYVAFTLALQRSSYTWVLASGVIAGAALATNQTTGIHLLAIGYLTYRLFPEQKPRAIVLLAGGAALIPLTIGVFYLANGSFGNLWYGAVAYPLVYGDKAPLLDRAAMGWMSTVRFLLVAAALTFPALWGMAQQFGKRRDYAVHILITWTLASAATVALTGLFLIYYYIAVIPPLALWAGLAVPPRLRLHWRSLAFRAALW